MRIWRISTIVRNFMQINVNDISWIEMRSGRSSYTFRNTSVTKLYLEAALRAFLSLRWTVQLPRAEGHVPLSQIKPTASLPLALSFRNLHMIVG